MKKYCPNCDYYKDASEFSSDKRTASGLNAYCRPCVAARRKSKPVGRPRQAVKTCPTCGETRMSEFGIDRRASDGLNCYCRACVRAQGNKRNAAKRKPCVVSPAEKVRHAIQRPRTREEIEKITGYDEQIVSDVLAQMWDSGEARIDRETRRFKAA